MSVGERRREIDQIKQRRGSSADATGILPQENKVILPDKLLSAAQSAPDLTRSRINES